MGQFFFSDKYGNGSGRKEESDGGGEGEEQEDGDDEASVDEEVLPGPDPGPHAAAAAAGPADPGRCGPPGHRQEAEGLERPPEARAPSLRGRRRRREVHFPEELEVFPNRFLRNVRLAFDHLNAMAHVIKSLCLPAGPGVHRAPDADGDIRGNLRRRGARQGVRALQIQGKLLQAAHVQSRT